MRALFILIASVLTAVGAVVNPGGGGSGSSGSGGTNLYASLQFDVTNTITIGALNTYRIVTNWHGSLVNGLTTDSTKTYITNQIAGYYSVNYVMNVSSANGDQIESAVFTNGVESILGSHMNSPGTSLFESSTANGIMYLPANTWLDVRVKNIISTANVTAVHGQFTVMTGPLGSLAQASLLSAGATGSDLTMSGTVTAGSFVTTGTSNYLAGKLGIAGAAGANALGVAGNVAALSFTGDASGTTNYQGGNVVGAVPLATALSGQIATNNVKGTPTTGYVPTVQANGDLSYAAGGSGGGGGIATNTGPAVLAIVASHVAVNFVNYTNTYQITMSEAAQIDNPAAAPVGQYSFKIDIIMGAGGVPTWDTKWIVNRELGGSTAALGINATSGKHSRLSCVYLSSSDKYMIEGISSEP